MHPVAMDRGKDELVMYIPTSFIVRYQEDNQTPKLAQLTADVTIGTETTKHWLTTSFATVVITWEDGGGAQAEIYGDIEESVLQEYITYATDNTPLKQFIGQ